MKAETLNQNIEKNIFLWNDFVNNSPQGSIFSTIEYLNSLKIIYKILVVKSTDGSILAGIVLAKNSINTFSNPTLDKYLGVQLRKEENLTHKKISQQYKVLDLLSKILRKYKSFDYYFHPEFKNWIPFYWNNFAQEIRYTYQIDLSLDIEQIQKKFHGNLRNDIKNSIKMGVNIRQNIEFESFFHIINKTFLRQGSKSPFKKSELISFIENLTRSNKFISFGAYNRKNKLIAACGLVYDKKSSYLILNGIDIDNQIRGANAASILEAIKFFKQKKTPLFDFEGSMLPGVEPFYRKFGGQLVPYMHIWSNNLFNFVKFKAKKFFKKIKYGK